MNVGNFTNNPEVDLVPKYYSDHDAICISWDRSPDENSNFLSRARK